MAEKFVRFITFETDPVSGNRIGFFQKAHQLKYLEGVGGHDVDAVEALLDWFDDHLQRPTRFSKSSRVGAHERALSWFKPTASAHIAKARQLLEILDRYGVQSDMLTSARPGVIVYEDESQIAAIPFRQSDF